MSAPLVSVLMTSYNRERYLAAAVESVLSSTMPDFELIIVDDRSTDGTVEIAQSYAAKDQRVRVYVNEINLGDYPNRNQAAAYARGKYLKYVDADDLIYPWGLELLVTMMEQFPEAGFGLCSLDQNVDRPFPFQLSPREAYHYHYFGPGLFNKAPLSAMIRRENFEKVGGFKSIRMAGDFEMWHRLALHFPVVAMPHGIVWYRRHAAQEMASYRKFIENYETIKYQFLNDPQCPLETGSIKKIAQKAKVDSIKGLMKGVVLFDRNRMSDNFKRYRIAMRYS